MHELAMTAELRGVVSMVVWTVVLITYLVARDKRKGGSAGPATEFAYKASRVSLRIMLVLVLIALALVAAVGSYLIAVF